MAAKAVQISLDDRLLTRIDKDAETRANGRSSFIKKAAEAYLAAKRRRDVDDAIRRAYANGEDEDIVDLMRAQAWPKK